MTHIKTHIKRGAAFLLCLCMALSLCACGGKGGEDTEAGALPKEEGKKTAPPSDGPLPLSQYIQSSEMQILYEADNLDKNTRPLIFLFQNGTVTYSNPDLTLGDLSKMSDEEIIQAVMAAEGAPEPQPCFLSLTTDSTGNAVEKESLYYLLLGALSSRLSSMSFSRLVPSNGVVYDSTYTCFSPSNNSTLFFVRGEQLPFVLDEIGAEGVEIDPDSMWLKEKLYSMAQITLIDGTVVYPPEPFEDQAITSYLLTGDGQKTLSLDDVQFVVPEYFDCSPSALQTEEGRAAFHSWYTTNAYGKINPIPAHEYESVSVHNYGLQFIYYNESDAEQEAQNLAPVGIIMEYPNWTVEGRTGQFTSLLNDSSDDIESLVREYGPPSGAILKWYEHVSRVKAAVTYYWAGDGFYLYVVPKRESFHDSLDSYSVRWLKSGGIGPQVMAKWGDSEICEEIERLLPN